MPVLSCGLSCVLCAGCARWACRRCSHSAADDTAAWPAAAPSDFSAVPRAARSVLAAYEDDLLRPRWAPLPGGYRIDPASVARRADYPDTGGRCPPYLIYADRAADEIVLAVRGLDLGRRSDYRLLLDNGAGSAAFDGGYVHRGLLKAAVWLLNKEADTLCRLVKESGPECRLVLAGHSLGSGVAALMAAVMVNYLDRFGGITRSRVRCYAIAPARCMSMNLALKYADVIHSVVLQDDFLPRTPTPLEHIFGSIFCLPCLLFFVCLRDTFISEDRKLKDPRRLYAPGRMYHIVERKACRCGRFPPEVRTAIPVEGRFEHIVLSCNAIFDHSIVWIEREAQKALEMMEESAEASTAPILQKMEREQSLVNEHKDAIEKALSLNLMLQAVSASSEATSPDEDGTSCSGSRSSERSTNWDELVDKLFDEDKTEDLVIEQGIGSCYSVEDPFPIT